MFPRLTRQCACLYLWPVLAASIVQAFEDDFEGYAAGSTAVWDVGSGAPVVNEATFALFGSPNRSLDLTGSGRKILTGVSGHAEGVVTTFSFDFVEVSGGPRTSGLQAGYAEATDINTAGGAVRVQLVNGQVLHSNLGGLSTLTDLGTVTYAEDQAHRLYIVVNDTPGDLIDYQGDEDLAAGSYEVWLRTGATLQHVLEATIARTLNNAGFRTWSGFDSEFYVDLVRISTGVNLTPGEQGCSIASSHPAIAAGGTVTLGWSASGLPAVTTCEISSNGTVTFSNGSPSGDASAGSGEVDATVTWRSPSPATWGARSTGWFPPAARRRHSLRAPGPCRSGSVRPTSSVTTTGARRTGIRQTWRPFTCLHAGCTSVPRRPCLDRTTGGSRLPWR